MTAVELIEIDSQLKSLYPATDDANEKVAKVTEKIDHGLLCSLVDFLIITVFLYCLITASF